MFGEVGEVFGIEGGQRQALDHAAGSDPAVVYRSGATPKLGVSLHLAPFDSHGLVEGEQYHLLAPVRETSQAAWPPVSGGRSTWSVRRESRT